MTDLYLGERSQEYYVRGHSKTPTTGLQSPMTIHNKLLDELLAGQDPSSVMRQGGLLGELKKALASNNSYRLLEL
jgi:hypothetical protein